MKRFLIAAIALVAVFVYPAAFAQVKISALPSATALTGTEQIPGVQSSNTTKMTPAQINAYIRSLAGSWTGNQSVTGTLSATGQIQSTFVTTATVPNFSAFSTAPSFELRDSDSAANAQRWSWSTSGTTLTAKACSDDGSTCTPYLQADRLAGSANIGQIALGNATSNPNLLWAGTGSWVVGGGAGTSGQVLTSNGAGAAPTWQNSGGGGPTSNTWVTTCWLGTGTSACAIQQGFYIRVGNIVNWSFVVNITNSSAVFASGIDLPVASNFAAVTDAAGVCTSVANQINAGRITAIIADDRLQIDGRSATTAQSQPWACSGSYQVL